MTMSVGSTIDCPAAREWYRRNRERSQAIFDLIDPAAYYSRPIALRNPIVFYEGHLPAFSVIAFLRRGLGLPPVDRRLEDLFARGIDPETEQSAAPRSGASTRWPSRDEVRAFAGACDAAVLRALEHEAWPTEGVYTALEHEAMHQETLLYMWHRLPYEQKRRPEVGGRRPEVGDRRSEIGGRRSEVGDRRSEVGGRRAEVGGRRSEVGGRRSEVGDRRSEIGGRYPATVAVPAGDATLGAARDEIAFGWDNEFDRHVVRVPAFDVDVLPVTNAQFLEFIGAGGYRDRVLWDEEGWGWVQENQVQHPAFWLRGSQESASSRQPQASNHPDPHWWWRGMFEAIPLPTSWPVYVSHAEASAYARWKGRRLMTEPEFHRAAYGTPSGEERAHPWGGVDADGTRGSFDFAGFDPVPVGSHPPGASAWGVQELVGNGWEWTSTVFAPFPGFAPMASYPEYSTDFFDGRHYVMKGASPATARPLVRRSFRNWFRGTYPYVYAKFRTVR